MRGTPLPRSFYQHPDVLNLAHNLIGMSLLTSFRNTLTAGIIVETEAYTGIGKTDKACHAYDGKRTKRTETMFMDGGHAYIYLCYGMHHLFNIVTNQKEHPDAILIRAIAPTLGTSTMLRRKKQKKLAPPLTSGPGSLTRALGIRTTHDRTDLCNPTGNSRIWIEDTRTSQPPFSITTTPRIGVHYAGEHSKLPWRFLMSENPWISKAKP